MPRRSTTGRKIGVKMSTAGVMSMNVPTKRRITLMISRMMYLLLVKPRRAAEIDWGMFS